MMLKCVRIRSWGQRGLLFGLDARVALGIFAALALVVGFLGYGRIKSAHETVLIKELQTFEDGLAAFQADVGVFIPFALRRGSENFFDSSQHLSVLWSDQLIKSGFIQHWHGPYVHRSSNRIAPNGHVEILYATPFGPEVPCTADTACAVWLKVTSISYQVLARLEELLDVQAGQGDTGSTTGRIRISGSGEGAALYYLTKVQRTKL